jgi:hypothetical protein
MNLSLDLDGRRLGWQNPTDLAAIYGQNLKLRDRPEFP